ncbi:hypothetical protein LCGC14_1605940, partial [marine sediment metagenome]
ATRLRRTYTSDTFETLPYAFAEDVMDRERDVSDSIINPEADAAALITRRLKLAREVRINTQVMTSGNWTTTSAVTTKWNTADGTSVVIEQDINVAKEVIHKQVGIMPNTIVIPFHISLWAAQDPKIRDLIKHTQSDLLVNGSLPPVLFGLNVIIPLSLNNEADPGVATESIDRLWDDNSVWVGYVNPNTSPNKGELSSLYTFRFPVGGNLDVAISRYRDDSIRATVVEGEMEEVSKVISAGAGYVLTGAFA